MANKADIGRESIRLKITGLGTQTSIFCNNFRSQPYEGLYPVRRLPTLQHPVFRQKNFNGLKKNPDLLATMIILAMYLVKVLCTISSYLIVTPKDERLDLYALIIVKYAKKDKTYRLKFQFL